MRYLWRKPHRLDNTELVKVLGEEPRTSIVDSGQTDASRPQVPLMVGAMRLGLEGAWREHPSIRPDGI